MSTGTATCNLLGHSAAVASQDLGETQQSRTSTSPNLAPVADTPPVPLVVLLDTDGLSDQDNEGNVTMCPYCKQPQSSSVETLFGTSRATSVPACLASRSASSSSGSGGSGKEEMLLYAELDKLRRKSRPGYLTAEPECPTWWRTHEPKLFRERAAYHPPPSPPPRASATGTPAKQSKELTTTALDKITSELTSAPRIEPMPNTCTCLPCPDQGPLKILHAVPSSLPVPVCSSALDGKIRTWFEKSVPFPAAK